MSETAGSMGTTVGTGEKVAQGLFDTAGTAIKGFFTYKTAKETSKAIAGAPIGNAAIIGGVIVLVVAMIFVLRR
jgi:hypothetical protein